MASIHSRKRILVVNDEPDITFTLQAGLEDDGFDVDAFIDPELVCFLTASEIYRDEVREVEHCALNKDLFLQKPISNDDLIIEIKKRIAST